MSKVLIAKGEQADRLLKDPILIEAFEKCRSNLLESFEKAPISDTEGIISLRLQLKALQSVRTLLERCVSDGNVAKAKEGKNVG